jgi:hypothetical protein
MRLYKYYDCKVSVAKYENLWSRDSRAGTDWLETANTKVALTDLEGGRGLTAEVGGRQPEVNPARKQAAEDSGHIMRFALDGP